MVSLFSLFLVTHILLSAATKCYQCQSHQSNAEHTECIGSDSNTGIEGTVIGTVGTSGSEGWSDSSGDVSPINWTEFS